MFADAVADKAPERKGDDAQQQHARQHHNAEGEIERCNEWNGVFHRLLDLRLGGIHHVQRVVFQWQAIAEILFVLVEGFAHRGICAAARQLVQQRTGFHTVADAHLMLRHQIFQAGDRLIDRVVIRPSSLGICTASAFSCLS